MKDKEVKKFFSKVEKSGNGCWIWTGTTNGNGYGIFNSSCHIKYAHRWSYYYHGGELVDGLVIDHICNNKLCVNPSHLQQITQRENVERSSSVTNINKAKKFCSRGHPFDDKNTYFRKNGNRRCRECHNLEERLKREKRRK